MYVDIPKHRDSMFVWSLIHNNIYGSKWCPTGMVSFADYLGPQFVTWKFSYCVQRYFMNNRDVQMVSMI